MAGFEFLFTFYGLLLGLAVANVATGFADMWRGRAHIAVGAAPPLLGLFILLAASQQWVSFWGGRDVIPMGPWEMLTSLGSALPYIFVSQAMVPRDPDAWTSLEDYYLKHSRVLMGVLTIPPLVSLAYNIGLRHALGMPFPAADFWVSYGLRLLIPVALLIWQGRQIHRIGVGLLCLFELMQLFDPI